MIKQISYIIIVFSLFISVSIDAQSLWKKSDITTFRDAPEEDIMILPEHYLAYQLSYEDLKINLENAPTEESWKNGKSGTFISLPLPDGSFEVFEMYDAPVFAPKLAEKYPSIKSYKGISTKTPGMNVRFDTGPYGFHAAIHGISDVIYIDPYARGNTAEYLTYNVKDHMSQMDLDVPMCGNHDEFVASKKEDYSKPRNSAPVALQVYRFALACTGEWGAQRGTVENALADMNTGVNRVNQIFENELAMRLVLIENNDLLLNFDGDTDPYGIVNNSSSDPNPTVDESNALSVNTNILNFRVGNDSYDLGHLYHLRCDVGGIARLGSMCNASQKGAGLTCHYTSLDYMAASVTSHEIGHQMSAQHTFNNCNGNENPENAFEPGSGSTIMSYGGSCGSQNVVGPFQDDDYYHVASLMQIYNHTRNGIAGENCAEVVETSNLEPTVTIFHDNDFYIPENTYFFLEGIGHDENEEDILTYTWEQMNIGNPQDGGSQLGSPIGDAPHFRSFPPRTSAIRYFPSPDNILEGSFDETEVPFEGDRTVNFALTVRDNNSEAGTAVWDQLQFHVVDTPVKFGVTSQSASETYEVGNEIDVTWNVASTNLEPVNLKFVDILLFTGTQLDFNLSNATVLAKGVFNSGSCKVIIPDEITQRGRIIVKATEGNFFSINSTNISIEASPTPKLIVNAEPLAQTSCDPTSFTYEINSENYLGIEGDITYTIIDGLPEGAVATFDPPTVVSGTASTLTIDPVYDPVGSENEIRIGAITESLDTFSRLIYLNLVSRDHSFINAITPEKDAVGIGVTTPFTWSASPNAVFYQFELSESPVFGATNIAAISGLTGLTYEPVVFLEKNTIYYWRITASNDCGVDPDPRVFAFSTESLFCTEVSPAEGILPINISASGLPTIQAPLEVEISGDILDINVKRFFGEHENNKDMTVSLISPDEKKVILVSNKCNQQDFNCGFDDASNVDVKCPLNNGSVYIPTESLSSFNGDPIEGTWIFQIEDTKSGNGGKLVDVIVEFCSNQVLDNPFIVRNQQLSLPADFTEIINADLLEVDDANNSKDELIYTIVTLPKNGELYYDGVAVEVGDQFTQKDVDDNKLSYTSSSADYSTFFSFTVIDGEGGFIGVTNFEIEVNSTTSIKEKLVQDEVSIYPIPTRNMITIDFSNSNLAYTNLEIINLQGQTVLKDNLKSKENINLDISQLNSGLYIINLMADKALISKKLIVSK